MAKISKADVIDRFRAEAVGIFGNQRGTDWLHDYRLTALRAIGFCGIGASVDNQYDLSFLPAYLQILLVLQYKNGMLLNFLAQDPADPEG